MKEKYHRPRYTIEDIPLAPTKSGRRKGKNNYDELVKLGVEGIILGKYKNYTQAAKDLYSLAREYIFQKENSFRKKEMPPYMSEESFVDRISRAISKAHKAHTS